MRRFCQKEGLLYVRDNDFFQHPFNDSPIVVNYVFHEEIIPSAKKQAKPYHRGANKNTLTFLDLTHIINQEISI